MIMTTQGSALFATTFPTPQQVWGQFIHKNELCILFGDSNTGKSILANDIAFAVTGGTNYFDDLTISPMCSMYIDMEMTRQQWCNRYIGLNGSVPNGYYRTEVSVLGSEEERILSLIKAHIIANQNKLDAPKFIVIDNITNGFGSVQSGTKMRNLISEFKHLKDRFGLTILLIAHCPKRKKATEITADNLGGSKMILNFVDSAFAIAPSVKGNDIKYLKQIKARACKKYEEVATIQISSDPYVHFDFVEWTNEKYHLNVGMINGTPNIPPDVEVEITKRLLDGWAVKSIADDLKLSYTLVLEYAYQNQLL